MRLIGMDACSIGSLGKNGAHHTVEEIYVRNCTFNRTTNGARIKTWIVRIQGIIEIHIYSKRIK